MQPPPSIQTLLARGDIAGVGKELEKTVGHLPKQHQLMPRFVTGVALMAQQAWAQAEDVFAWLHKTVPDHADSLRNLATCQLRQNKLPEAALSYTVLLRQQPQQLAVRLFLARLLNGLLRYPETVSLLTGQLRALPDHVEGHALLGQAQQALYMFDEAKESLFTAASLAPSDPRHFFNYCFLLDLMREKAALQAFVLENIAGLGASAEWQYWQAAIAQTPEEAMTILDLAAGHATPVVRAFIEFARGRILDARGDYEAAFEAFAHGNAAQVESGENSGFAHYDYISHLNGLTKFAAGKPELAKRRATDAQQVVFITGFPRSGTTLLGQILSMHDDVYVADEVPAINAMLSWIEEKNLAYPECLPQLSQDNLDALADRFWQAHKATPLYAAKPVFIDKMPLNCVHWALLACVFPDARHIFMLRDPVDCVLSAFMQHFRLNQALQYTTDLPRAAQLYMAAMEAAQAQRFFLPHASHDCRYEDLVHDLDGQLDAICDVLGIALQPAMLAFHEGKGAKPRTLTPSHAQISQKLYTRAAYRWKHYAHLLGDVPERLSGWTTKLGY